ncbi:MAG: flagella basal body P-ring formation protein FlgA [Rhodospirillales bacterium 20-64-7]|nr:MAG: flagella basal body P-ring formation protein FlgA [Rhodospirillales bacterium 20-64-7]
MRLAAAIAGRALMLAALLPAGPTLAAASHTQDPVAVAAAVRAAAAAQAPAGSTITIGTVQGAAVMPACAAKFGVEISGVEPYEQATVRCPTPDWTLYVAVTVAATQEVVVTARPVAAGAPLEPGDVTLQRKPVAAYAGRQAFYDTAGLLGATATMNLPAGAVLTGADIQEPVLVQAGQTASVTVVSGGVRLTVNAVADQAGRVGETILMTNPSSGQRFHALVTPTGPEVRLQ